MHKLKGTSHANISAVPQAVGVSIGQSSGQVSHELIVSKPEPSQAVNLPIEFVPAMLPEPLDVGPSSLKKRRKNKKKPNKKLRSDTQYVLISLSFHVWHDSCLICCRFHSLGNITILATSF